MKHGIHIDREDLTLVEEAEKSKIGGMVLGKEGFLIDFKCSVLCRVNRGNRQKSSFQSCR